MNRLLFVVCAIVMPAATLLAQGARNAIPLLEAQNSGKVQVSIRGAYNPIKAQPDVESAHYGECLDIRLRNVSDVSLDLILQSGTMLFAKDSSSQDMLVTKTQYFTLQPKEKVADRLYAVCGELHKNAPDVYIHYAVGKLAPEPVVKICQTIELMGAQNKAAQYAVWAVTDKATKHDLGEDYATLAESQELLNKADIKFDVFAGERPKNVKASKANDKKIVENLLPPPTASRGSNIAAGTENGNITNSPILMTQPQTQWVSQYQAYKNSDNNVYYWYALAAILILGYTLYRTQKEHIA